ncbi:TetR/AcrR family transcriptional regulator [Falsiruegeria mediterranea]|nr:TetR/AcrR family transcriptional regulator [Falsiruegeria mediterranea]
MEKRRKRVRTRAALLAVAAREIEQVGYDSLTMDHLANAAGLVRGTLYLYYHSRADIVKAVLRKYWALMRIHRPRGGGLGLKASIHRANTYSVMLAARNPRLLEAREILLREDAEVAARMASVNRIWSERIVSDLIRRGLTAQDDEDLSFLRLKARAVINMSDTLLSDVHRLSGWDDTEGPIDLDLVIRVMDDLWYRSLYLPQPDEA